MCAPSDWCKFFFIFFGETQTLATLFGGSAEEAEKDFEPFRFAVDLLTLVVVALTVCRSCSSASALSWVRSFDMFWWRQHWVMRRAGQKMRSANFSGIRPRLSGRNSIQLFNALIVDSHHPGLRSRSGGSIKNLNGIGAGMGSIFVNRNCDKEASGSCDNVSVSEAAGNCSILGNISLKDEEDETKIKRQFCISEDNCKRISTERASKTVHEAHKRPSRSAFVPRRFSPRDHCSLAYRNWMLICVSIKARSVRCWLHLEFRWMSLSRVI